MGAIAPQITRLVSVYSAVWLGADQGKHQSSASLAFVRGIHRRPGKSPHKGPVTRKMFPFDDVITDRHQPEVAQYALWRAWLNFFLMINYGNYVSGIWASWVSPQLTPCRKGNSASCPSRKCARSCAHPLSTAMSYARSRYHLCCCMWTLWYYQSYTSSSPSASSVDSTFFFS